MKSDLSKFEHFSFGDGPEMADALLALVLSGRKTATCWSAADGQKGIDIGVRSVACDGAGHPRALLETVSVERRAFEDVDENFAVKEGEGDLSLRHWREVHQKYFERHGGFGPRMDLWCEEFRIVEVYPSDGVPVRQ